MGLSLREGDLELLHALLRVGEGLLRLLGAEGRGLAAGPAVGLRAVEAPGPPRAAFHTSSNPRFDHADHNASVTYTSIFHNPFLN